jgi:pentatricopeptide repeat protein
MSVRSVVTWNALIAGHAQHGNGEETLELFNQMQDAGVIPTDVTFISVLNACSHAGLVNEGCHWFNCMCRKYGIKASVDHYGCMVDLLGRAGLLSEAEGLIDNMPEEPTVATWMSLLGACRHQTDLNRAERAFTNLFHLDPINPGPRVMLFNMYALSGTVDTTTWLTNTDVSSIS